MDERNHGNIREINTGSALFRCPKGLRPVLWEEEDQCLLRAHERALLENERRPGKGIIVLTETALINHIISLIDLGKENNPIIIQNFDGTCTVNSNYRLKLDGYQASIDTYVLPLLEPRRQLRMIAKFAAKDLSAATARILQEFCVDFLLNHAVAINDYYTDTNLGLQTLCVGLYDLIQPLTFTYNILYNVLSEDVWNYETVERFLERFIHMMILADLQTGQAQTIIRNLQNAFFPLLERYFDHIFKNGTVEPIYINEFLFYNVTEDGSDVYIELREPLCSFWSKALVKNVLNGARDARRLNIGLKDFKRQAFSYYFRERFPWDGDSMMKFSEFMNRVSRAAELCAQENARTLFTLLGEGNKLKIMLDEIEQVYTGFSLRDLAYDLFGADRTSENCDIALSFYNSLRSSGFNAESCERWSINCSSGYLEDLTIQPKIEWPLNYVISNELIEKCNSCLRFLLQLIRASELLSKIRTEYTEVEQLGLNKRRFSLLLCVISQPLTIMTELLFTHLSSLMSKKLPLICSAKTVEEAQVHVRSLTRLLNNLVMKEGARRLIHEAIVKLCNMSDEIDRRLRMDCMKPSDLEQLLKVAVREKQLLVGIGRGMEGTLFMALQLFLA